MTDKIQCGLYYVKTDNRFPFRECGFYSQPLVEYGIQQNIITKEDIKLKFIPSYSLPHDYFKPIVEKILNAFKDLDDYKAKNTLQKLAVNSYIGCLARMLYNRCKSEYTTSHMEAISYISKFKEENCIVREHLIGDIPKHFLVSCFFSSAYSIV